MVHALKPDDLRYSFDCSSIGCETTAELVAPQTIIGQERGVRAIEFGLTIDSPGYNVYVLGESGTGRTTAILRFVESHSVDTVAPNDWLYVNNFDTPHRPRAIALPAGRGTVFSNRMAHAITQIRKNLASAFDNQTFREAALAIQQTLNASRENVMRVLQEKGQAQGVLIVPTPEGMRIVPAINGQPLNPEQFNQLPEEVQQKYQDTIVGLQQELNESVFQIRRLDKAAGDELADLVKRVGKSVVDVVIDELDVEFQDVPALHSYLGSVRKDIVENVDAFRSTTDEDGEENELPQPQQAWFRRYQVNVIVNHAESKRAPVIAEYDPTVPRLLGRVEHEARHGGAVVTDFTLLRSGALHAANGGFLVLRARDLFSEPGAWDALKRALVGGTIRPDDPAIRGGAATRSLDPEPIPLALKVILVGPPQLYYMLLNSDEDFRSIFKVMADFDAVVARTASNENAYARFIASLCDEESLYHLTSDAVGRVIEYGARMAGTQDKLSTRFGQIADLVREANFWAKKEGRAITELEDVIHAIDNRIYLRNRIEMSMLDFLLEGKRMIATDGAVVGQINALSVSQIGEHAFGQPSRVTARTYVGQTGVVAIDREVHLAGPIHNKGLMTLVGYLGGQYAATHPLSLAAQITFEQNYGGIDGDSASSTELYALLSSLSNIPIKQAFAVTGSVNQLGEVQVIGGVTQKVEGWFTVCQRRGLTGEQGVLIPAGNAPDLMLREDVIDAVKAGQFNIYAIETIDEGIELLTGRPAAEIHEAVKEKLQSLADIMRRYGD